jgi:hypothetical protein
MVPSFTQFGLATAILFVIAPSMPVLADGRLDEVRDEVRNSDGDDDDDDRCRDDDDDDWDDDDWDDDDDDTLGGTFGEAVGQFVFTLAISPWFAPPALLDDEASLFADFPRAPYADDVPGHLLIWSSLPDDARSWNARLAAFYGDSFDGLHRAGARLQLDTASRFGLDAEWHQWVEDAARGRDTLAVGDANFIYRFAQHEQAEFHTGLGFNWLADRARADFGFNFTYGVDLFPRRPWVISAVFDAGTLGEAGYFHGRTSVGVIWEQVELFAGYDVQRFGNARLDGLIAGMQFWF